MARQALVHEGKAEGKAEGVAGAIVEVLDTRGISVSNDVRAFAPRIAQATLLIAAEKDDITPIAAERHLQTLFPRAELVEIPEVGHLIHYETPEAAADAITE